MTALQLVDSEGTVLFDLDDPTGAANPHLLKTRLRMLDLGAPDREAALFSPSSKPGALRVHVKDEAAVGQAILSIESTSSDDLLAGYGELAYLVKKEGVALQLQANGMTEARTVELVDASLDRLLRGGDREGVARFQGFYDDELGLTFTRQPSLKGAELDSDTNKLRNSTLLFDSNGDGRPDEWAWLSATNISAESIDAPTESYKFHIVPTTARSLQQQSAVGSYAPGDIVTFSYYVKAALPGIVSARAAVQFYQSDGTTAVGSEHVGTLTDIDTSWTRVSVTTPAAGALTSRATVTIRIASDDTYIDTYIDTYEESYETDVWVRRAQFEEAAEVSTFVTSSEVVPSDPLQEKPHAPIPPVASDGGAGGLLSAGTYSWQVSYVTAAGQTLPSAKSNVLSLAGSRKGSLVFPTGPSGVTQRKIYRTAVNEALPYKLVATVADNTTTTYLDNIADASLGVAAPTTNTTAAVTPKLGRWYPVFNAGDEWAPFLFEITGDSEAAIQSVQLASLSALEEGGKSVARFLNSPPFIQAEDADFTHSGAVAGGGTAPGTVEADGDATGDQAVKYTTASGDLFRRCLRVELDDLDELEGYRGTFNWKLRLRQTAATQREFQLRWANSMEEPASFSNLPVRQNADSAGLSTFGYVEINLGPTALPTEGVLEGLSLEVWARYISGAVSDLYLDCLIPVPTEQSATVSLPYTGRNVVAESQSATLGSSLGANRWRVTWRYSVQAPSATYVAGFRVRRDTSGSGTIITDLQMSHPYDVTNVSASLEFSSLSSVSYFANTDIVAGTGTITVHEITMEKVCVLEEDMTLVTDPNLGSDRAYLLSDMGRYMCPAYIAGPTPFWLPPGLSLVYIEVSEPRIGGLYSELKSELRRKPTVSHRYAPRYST